MPTRDTAPQGAPCWLDLGSSDTDKSAHFYDKLLGWTAESAGEEFGGYITFAKDDVPVAGCMQSDGTMGPDGWSTYLATDDIAKLTEQATAKGGSVASAAMAVGDLGHMAFVLDPDQAFVGAWQSGLHRGFGVFAEPGTPGWFELFTRDWEGALAFYRDVFGSTIEVVSDAPEFRYAVLTEGGLQVAGIMDAGQFLPEGVPSHWSVYFQVESADAACTLVQELGGTVIQPPEDTPYGRLATLVDSTGAAFKLLQPPS